MKRELRDKWVAALRSGEFKRATGRLYKKDEGYCCLGVLAVVAGLPLGDGTSSANDPRPTDGAVYGYNKNRIFTLDPLLPQEVASELFSLNDRRRATFEQVADRIEQIVPVED